jgi:hypothetical protein
MPGANITYFTGEGIYLLAIVSLFGLYGIWRVVDDVLPTPPPGSKKSFGREAIPILAALIVGVLLLLSAHVIDTGPVDTG